MIIPGIKSQQMDTEEANSEFLISLKKRTLYKNNCIKISNETGKVELLSSPYVAAIAARILMVLPSNPIKYEILADTKNYLLKCMDENGLIGFLHPNHHRHDLDTQAVCYAFLYDVTKPEIEQKLRKILGILSSYKDPISGAYFTWVNKKNNIVDYMVNLNIEFLFSIINHYDRGLVKYLNEKAHHFIANGSQYYRELAFPLFLVSVYDRFLLPSINNGSHHAILSRIMQHRYASSKPDHLLRAMSFANNRANVAAGRYQLFNSRDGTYYSSIIDDLIIRQLYYDVGHTYSSSSP
jgi:hypothetical protein